MNNSSRELTFKFVFPDDYNPFYANGVHGEITQSGEFVLHFVQERRPVPKSITHTVTEDGKLGQEVKRDPKDHGDLIIKYVTTGVTLNYVAAKSIHSWLGDMLGHFEKTAGINPDVGNDAYLQEDNNGNNARE